MKIKPEKKEINSKLEHTQYFMRKEWNRACDEWEAYHQEVISRLPELTHFVKCYMCNELHIDITTYGAEKLMEALHDRINKENV